MRVLLVTKCSIDNGFKFVNLHYDVITIRTLFGVFHTNSARLNKQTLIYFADKVGRTFPAIYLDQVSGVFDTMGNAYSDIYIVMLILPLIL